jgi:hypothetical protein
MAVDETRRYLCFRPSRSNAGVHLLEAVLGWPGHSETGADACWVPQRKLRSKRSRHLDRGSSIITPAELLSAVSHANSPGANLVPGRNTANQSPATTRNQELLASGVMELITALATGGHGRRRRADRPYCADSRRK